MEIMDHPHSSHNTQIPGDLLNHDQLQAALAEAIRHFSLIRKKFPDLKAYLVLSLLGGQTNIESSPENMLTEFPGMVVDDEDKTRMQAFLRNPLPKDAKKSEKERWLKKLQELSVTLKYVGKIQVEICFKELNYELIWKLQSDDLVNRDLTPQTKASIRIVLGTISHFSRLAVE